MAKQTGQQLIQKAGKYHSEGKFGQAEKIYKRLLKANPNDLTLLRLLGMLERDRQQPKAALNWFRLARQVSGDDPVILSELALTLEQIGQSDKAMDIAELAIQKSPENPSVATFFAKMCLARGLGSRAVQSLQFTIENYPTHQEAILLLAVAINSTGTLPIPLDYANKAIELNPQEAIPLATLGTAHRLNANTSEALDAYEQALNLDPNLPEAIAGKAEILESLGKTAEAEAFLANFPSTHSVSIALAKVRIARKLNTPETALNVIDSALNQLLSPHHKSNLLMHKGRVLEELQRYDEAWKCWEQGNALHGGTFPLEEHIKLVDTIIGSCRG